MLTESKKKPTSWSRSTRSTQILKEKKTLSRVPFPLKGRKGGGRGLMIKIVLTSRLRKGRRRRKNFYLFLQALIRTWRYISRPTLTLTQLYLILTIETVQRAEALQSIGDARNFLIFRRTQNSWKH